MSSSNQKKGKKNPASRSRSNASTAHSYTAPLSFILCALGGAGLFLLVYKIQMFKYEWSAGIPMVMALICGAIAGFGTTAFFKDRVDRIALFSFPLLVIQIVANILLTYQWTSQNDFLLFLTNGLTLPLGLIWYHVLRYKSFTETPPASNGEYNFREVFKGILPKVIGGLIIVACAVLFFYRLGYYDIWEDENLVINAAKGFNEQGWAYFTEGYDRAWLHTVIISGFFDVFGISEWSGRLPSAVFGVLFIVLCFYVFARWFGLAWLALLIPAVCLMNDRFLILFRYMRMYALLIPLFLLGAYIIHRALRSLQPDPLTPGSTVPNRTKWILLAIALCFLPLLAHVHKLSMVMLPVFGLFILYLALVQRTKTQMRLLAVASAGVVILLILTFVVQLESLKMFQQVAKRIFSPPNPMPAYFEYMLGNGLPANSSIMVLVAGLGLITSRIAAPIRNLVVFNYLLVTVALVSMVYLVTAEGRDYRYIAHIVPFMVCTLLLVMHYIGKALWRGSYPWVIILTFIIASLDMVQDYERIYIRHPWAPRYSIVYKTLVDNYKQGDALFAINIKTYYLDPVALAGKRYYKISKKVDYTRDQFVNDIIVAQRGWVMWELHKSHQWSKEVLAYIYKNFKPYHSQQLDDDGVALFYFDTTMIPRDH